MVKQRLRRSLAGAVVCLAAAGCGGSSGGGGTNVNAYVKSACTALKPFATELSTGEASLTQQTLANPVSGRAALVSFLSASAKASGTALSALKGLGSPNVANGGKIESGLVDAFGKIQTAFAAASKQASSLPTSSSTTFTVAVASLEQTLQKAMSGPTPLDNLKSPALEKAAKTEPSCKALNVFSSGGSTTPTG